MLDNDRELIFIFRFIFILYILRKFWVICLLLFVKNEIEVYVNFDFLVF